MEEFPPEQTSPPDGTEFRCFEALAIDRRITSSAGDVRKGKSVFQHFPQVPGLQEMAPDAMSITMQPKVIGESREPTEKRYSGVVN